MVGRSDVGEGSRTCGAGVCGARRRRSVDRRRHGVSEEGFAFGWRGTTILRAAGQDGQLSDRGDAIDRQSSCKSADRLSAVSARNLGERRRASRKGACSRGRRIQDQAADCARPDRGRPEGRRGQGRRADRRRLRLRRGLPRWRHGAGVGLCGGRAIDAVGLASRRRAIAAQTLERPGAQAFASATRRRSSADFGQRACDAPARRGLEGCRVARRLEPAFSSRFAAARVRPASRDHKLVAPHPVEWLVIEWPGGEAEPTKYWLSTLPEDMPLAVLVNVIKLRWRIERDYEELKSELGLAHFEGRGWRGFHHHASLCIAAYGFLILERSAFPPSARWRSEKPPLSGRSRSPRAPNTSRTPCGQLDRDDAQAIDDRPSKIPLSMPLLSNRLKDTELQPALMTQ